MQNHYFNLVSLWRWQNDKGLASVTTDSSAHTIKMYTLTKNEPHQLLNKDLIHRQRIAKGTIKQKNKGAITPITGVEHQAIIAAHHASQVKGDQSNSSAEKYHHNTIETSSSA